MDGGAVASPIWINRACALGKVVALRPDSLFLNFKHSESANVYTLEPFRSTIGPPTSIVIISNSANSKVRSTGSLVQARNTRKLTDNLPTNYQVLTASAFSTALRFLGAAGYLAAIELSEHLSLIYRCAPSAIATTYLAKALGATWLPPAPGVRPLAPSCTT